MITKIIVLLVVTLAVWLFYRWFMRNPPQQISRQLKKGALYAIAAVVIVMALTGRLHWLYAIAVGVVPFAQRLFALLRGYQMFKNVLGKPGGISGTGARQNQHQTSRIETQWLNMTLDHDSGELDGTVLQGHHRGQRLSSLDLEALLTLLAECRVAEEESATLLETYLDRRFDERWRDAHQSHASTNSATGSGAMSMEEAYQILGLQPGATQDEIRQAHRRLMQKFHPDRGGTTYLAAKINKAKDILEKEAA